ncbi:MAG: hypothetical protein ACPGJV_02090 [Bacteriovoracaceae bacterium]
MTNLITKIHFTRLVLLFLFFNTVFFIISMKYSGAEAYAHSGLLTYIKWGMIGLMANSGFIISLTRWGNKQVMTTILIAFVGIFANYLVFEIDMNFMWQQILGKILLFFAVFILVIFLLRAKKYVRPIQS